MEAKKKEHLKLEKQSGLYFAIGMTLILGLVYAALEWKTFDQIINGTFGQLEIPDSLEEEIPPLVQLLPPPPPKIQVPEFLEIIKNDDPEPETFIEPTEANQNTEVASVTSIEFAEEETPEEVIFINVEEVPVFPGCEKSDDKRACFQEKMLKHVRKNFKYPENAIDMGLQGKVYLQFTVQKDGTIGGLKMRGPHQILESEAARIISKLPKMKPGKQRNQAVKVPFSIPITFQLQ
ncbi:energy transducer TonB [Croceitalea vernalis]|uniref:Energy transducer TonB n=1 Tax=Croceitalea vernalis TaxID=3075599 RepID=A0ABU3BG19_9FLAO|nr:energy transducer TonB [Croceitalea sp. P007]MDT0621110.1 energy transducer TonB [Croceitalea sp. P007]